MNKETLVRAKKLEKDIQQMEFALSYYKRGRWSHWDINDSASSFHFEFCKNWSHESRDMQSLPTWLNGPLMEVVERELNRCKTELNNLGEEKPSAADNIVENMKELGKSINSMGVKVSALTNTLHKDCRIQTPPDHIGYLEMEETMTRLPVFKRIGWFRRMMLRLAFGLKYIKKEE